MSRPSVPLGLGVLALGAWFGAGWSYLGGWHLVPQATLVTGLKEKGARDISADGELLACQDPRTYDVCVWEVFSGRRRLVANGFTAYIDLHFSQDGSRLVGTTSDGMVKLWDTTSSQELARLQVYKQYEGRHYEVLSPDGWHLASSEKDEQFDGPVKLWDLKAGQNLVTSTRLAHSIAFTPRGQALAVENSKAGSQVWDVATGRNLCTLKGQYLNLTSVKFFPDGHRVLDTDFLTKRFAIWDLATGLRERTYRTEHSIYHLAAMSMDGSKLLAGYMDDAPELSVAERLFGHESAERMFPSQMGNTLIDLNSGQQLANLTRAECLAWQFMPDGNTFLGQCEGDDSLKLWHVPPRTEFRMVRFAIWLILAGLLSGVWWFPRRQTRVPLESEELREPTLA